MINSQHHWHTTLIVGALWLSIIACGLSSPNLGGPTAPEFASQPSPDAMASFNGKWRSLNLATPDGPFTITFTEAELTSALARAVEENTSPENAVPLKEPSIILQSEQILVYGTIQLDIMKASGLITTTPSIDSNGLIDINITNAEFGPIAVDPSMIDTLETRVAQAINEPIQASPFHIALNQLQISSGQMTISGVISP